MTCLKREEVLAYEARRRIYALIQREPGLHLRELERRSGTPLSTLRHHLRFLVDHRLVDAAADRNVQRYFATDFDQETDRGVIAALRQDALRRVVLHLLEEGGASMYQSLVTNLRFPPSTLAVHLQQLTARGIVRRVALGRESRYEVVNPGRVIRTLHAYRPSFFDSLVDRLLATIYEEDEPDD